MSDKIGDIKDIKGKKCRLVASKGTTTFIVGAPQMNGGNLPASTDIQMFFDQIPVPKDKEEFFQMPLPRGLGLELREVTAIEKDGYIVTIDFDYTSGHDGYYYRKLLWEVFKNG